MLLEAGVSNPVLHLRVSLDESLVDVPGTIELLVAELHLDEGEPSLFLRLPLRPPLKHLPAGRRELGVISNKACCQVHTEKISQL